MLINKHTCDFDSQEHTLLLISNICPSRVNTYARKLDRHLDLDNFTSTDWKREFDISGKLRSVLDTTIIATIMAVLYASLYRNLNVMLRR